jgi:hypothetical protein
LSSKFATGGDFGYNPNSSHDTEVAGVAGAATNNGIGIASLGWELKLLPYIYTPGPEGGTLPENISQALTEECKVINCSFSTGKQTWLRVAKPGQRIAT